MLHLGYAWERRIGEYRIFATLMFVLGYCDDLFIFTTLLGLFNPSREMEGKKINFMHTNFIRSTNSCPQSRVRPKYDSKHTKKTENMFARFAVQVK